MRRAGTSCLAALALVACTGGEAPRPRPGQRPPKVSLLAQNLALSAGAARATRIGVEPFGGSADFIVTFRPDTARVSVCPLETLDEDLPPIGRCRRDVGSGVRETVGAPAMRAVAILVGGEAGVSADLLLEYDEGGRRVTVVLPSVPPPASASACKDNECNPFFEMRPVRGGRFEATATWTGPEATLVLLQGSVLARSFTATGVPYREPARADGASPLRIATDLSSPGEYALVFRQEPGPRAAPLRDVAIDARWP